MTKVLPHIVIATALALCLDSHASDAPQVDPDTGARTWAISAQGVSISLTQILPEQVRAFYINRGFSAAEAESFATACVYMTVLRNDSAAGVLNYRLADWNLAYADKTTPLPNLDSWIADWRQRGVSEPARIAFRWAQFPPEQDYAQGEWNQGMLATRLSPGTVFDLVVRWTLQGTPYETRLQNVQCAQ